MSFYEFKKNDIIYNEIETNPKVSFFIYDNQVYYNNEKHIKNTFSSSLDLKHVPRGYISLYELNINRSDQHHFIHPFVTKEGSLTSFKTVSTESFNKDFQFGDVITGSYPMSASITRDHFATNHVSSSFAHDNDAGTFNRIHALQNTLNYYTRMSPEYAFSASYAGRTQNPSSGDDIGWDKGNQELGLISIPSIFYGSSIEKGSVELKFYQTGTLIGTLRDDNKNGDLLQVGPTGSNGSGSIAGSVLYNEGFIVLTGSWDISNGENTGPYFGSGQQNPPRWIDFGVGANDGTSHSISGSSFEINFNGLNRIPILTMFAKAPKIELNYSNNPSFLSKNQNITNTTGSAHYVENDKLLIKNVVSGAFTDHTGSFQKETYISQIGVYDENRNLIAIAKLATPVKKTEGRDYTFKLKYDF
tara:strand:- start:735 stop:1982 length:1248 start_codon:yes stop_codon:yes gene_type:complete